MTAHATPARTTGETTPEIDLVVEFLARLEGGDIPGALDLMSEDAVYQNVPLPPDRGKAAVRRTLERMMGVGDGFRVEYDNVAANGPVVLTERTDILSVRGVNARFWVCGTFEVHDGRITLWRDRFDWADFTFAWVRGGARAVRRAVRRRLDHP